MCSTRTEMCSMHPCLMQRCERCSVALTRAQQSPGSFLRMLWQSQKNKTKQNTDPEKAKIVLILQVYVQSHAPSKIQKATQNCPAFF